ncbi:MAG: hypothetical protein AAB804_00070 [Patescibacteria group bacterium]
MSASLKLISLNIQRSKHLDLVLPFLETQMPEVACVQELFESDIPELSNALGGARCVFAPMSKFIRDTAPQIMGVGIFLGHSARDNGISWYHGDPAELPVLDQDDRRTWNNKNFPLLWCDIEKDGTIFRIATTHFRWTPDGQADDGQRRDLKELLHAMEGVGECVLTGDFNAPRGREIFGMLAEKYKDNVPTHYISSLDPERHRVDNLQLMVDGVFSTPSYSVSDVEMICGISDHCALVANVSKAG